MDQGDWMTGWMNEQIKGEIEDLRSRFGFEEQQEAVAFWHIRRAEVLMTKMHIEDEERRGETQEEGDDAIVDNDKRLGVIIARSSDSAAEFATKFSQHFVALKRELGARILRREYPQGWDRETASDVPEEWLQSPPDSEGEPEG